MLGRPPLRLLLLLAGAAPPVAGLAGGRQGQGQGEQRRLERSLQATHAASVAASLLEAEDGFSMAKVLKQVRHDMNLQEAVRRAGSKLPGHVGALLQALSKGQQSPSKPPDLDEDSLQKARILLNGRISDSLSELDEVLVECTEFKRGNRDNFDQVATDLARLGSEIAEKEEMISESLGCISLQGQEYNKLYEKMQDKQEAHIKEKAEAEGELQARQRQLGVFRALLGLTECKNTTSAPGFLQVSSRSAAEGAGAGVNQLEVCDTHSGIEINFQDLRTSRRIQRLLTPEVKQVFRRVLEQAEAQKASMLFLHKLQAHALLEVEARAERRSKQDPGNSSNTSNASVTIPPLVPSTTQRPVPVKEDPARAKQWRKCVQGEPNCGMLYDSMSLQWGKYKDLVDELKDALARAMDDWEQDQKNINEQIELVTNQKSECQQQLDEATGAKNTLIEERKEKDTEQQELTREYERKMATCRARVEELLFTDICAVRTIRNSLMTASKVSPPSAIVDCDVGEWVPSTCSVECDNNCPHRVGGNIDPYQCGGQMQLSRTPVVSANQYGVACPKLTWTMRCGQHKCPVDCVLSEWSGWSKCTKECEGGVQQMTRSVITRAKHGGAACSTTVETRSCNTDSCDRDCVLAEWTEWSDCSMACRPPGDGSEAGFQERGRKVLVPIRGEGRCPTGDSPERFQTRPCNEQSCKGDEVCVAKQDLVIALDAAGSLGQAGFETLRNLSVSLVDRFTAKYYGVATMRVGVVLYGNGKRLPDETIAPAIQVQPLTSDLALVRTQLLATTWQQGFTNLAQALSVADTMFQLGGRSDAQSSVLVISDGKYSFVEETEHAANALKERNTLIYMAPVMQFLPADQEGMMAADRLKQWASQPWPNHYQLIPGLQALASNVRLFAGSLIARFCPESISPALSVQQEKSSGFMIIREGGLPGGDCGDPVNLGLVDTAQRCKEAASGQGMRIFAVGVGYHRGRLQCYGTSQVKQDVTDSTWVAWQANRADIQLPCGTWVQNPYFDTYAASP